MITDDDLMLELEKSVDHHDKMRETEIDAMAEILKRWLAGVSLRFPNHMIELIDAMGSFDMNAYSIHTERVFPIRYPDIQNDILVNMNDTLNSYVKWSHIYNADMGLYFYFQGKEVNGWKGSFYNRKLDLTPKEQ